MRKQGRRHGRSGNRAAVAAGMLVVLVAPASCNSTDCTATTTQAEAVVVRAKDAVLRARVTADGRPAPGSVRFTVFMDGGDDPFVTQGSDDTNAEGVAEYPLVKDIEFSFTREQLRRATHYEAQFGDRVATVYCRSSDEAPFRYEIFTQPAAHQPRDGPAASLARMRRGPTTSARLGT